MGTCPSKPGGIPAVSKANADPKTNVPRPKVNVAPRLNAGPKVNNAAQSRENRDKRMEFLENLDISTIMDIKELEKLRKELENFVMGFEMSGELLRGGEIDNTHTMFKNKIEKIDKQIEGINNGTLKPEPSAPELPNTSNTNEDPSQVGGKRRRTTKRKQKKSRRTRSNTRQRKH